MSEDVKVQDWMLKYEILYNSQQKPVIDKFKEYCRSHGYNRVAGLYALLDLADYLKQLNLVIEKVDKLSKEVEDFRNSLESPKEEDDKPKTMGSS